MQFCTCAHASQLQICIITCFWHLLILGSCCSTMDAHTHTCKHTHTHSQLRRSWHLSDASRELSILSPQGLSCLGVCGDEEGGKCRWGVEEMLRMWREGGVSKFRCSQLSGERIPPGTKSPAWICSPSSSSALLDRLHLRSLIRQDFMMWICNWLEI